MSFQERQVVVCIPSGRYRYLRVLLPYLLSARHQQIIDRIELWVNTDVLTDLSYFQRIQQSFLNKVVCIPNPGPLNKALYDAKRDHWQFNDGIYRFYPRCVEPETLYCKIDDDICYVDDDFFRNMFTAVIAREKTNYACVGNVFNIPYVTQVLQRRRVLDTKLGESTGDPRCPIACTNGEFAAHIHEQFLTLAEAGKTKNLYFDSHFITGRQRIGTMAWTGESFQQFAGRVGPRDEVELTTRIPEMLLKPLWIVGDAVVCHFAFSHQRGCLEDQTDALKRYLTLSIKLNGDLAM